jgi:hypothetical protein
MGWGGRGDQSRIMMKKMRMMKVVCVSELTLYTHLYIYMYICVYIYRYIRMYVQLHLYMHIYT